MSMGLTSASIGISGLVFSQINDRYFKSNAERHEEDSSTFDFLIFVGCCVAIVTFFGSFVLGPVNTATEEEEVHISHDILHEDEVVHSLNHHNYTQSISSFSTSSTRFEEEEEGMGEDRPLLSKNVIVSADNVAMFKNMAPQHQQVNIEEEPSISGIAFFMDPVGFSLAFALLVTLGLGYVYLANLGQLIMSMSPKDLSLSEAQHLRNLHVSIFSLANCGSRAVFGTLSDVLKRRAGVHRLWFFWSATIGLMITMTYLITSVSNADDLISCTVMTAIVYGIAFGVAPATISEFGTKVWLLFTLFMLHTSHRNSFPLDICSQLGMAIVCSSYWQSIIQCLIWNTLRERIKETRRYRRLLWIRLLSNDLFHWYSVCLGMHLYSIAGDLQKRLVL
jgi:hypothetical protein